MQASCAVIHVAVGRAQANQNAGSGGGKSRGSKWKAIQKKGKKERKEKAYLPSVNKAGEKRGFTTFFERDRRRTPQRGP